MTQVIMSKAPVFNKVNIFVESVLAQGNIVPYLWYSTILKDCGKPDTIAISILSDLASLYRNSAGRDCEFQLSYLELSSKFNYSLRQIYDGVVRLENRGLVKRKSDVIEVKGKRLGNFLFLTLNVEVLLKLHDSGDHNKDTKPTSIFDEVKTSSTCESSQVPGDTNLTTIDTSY